eukprot:scaffold71048_cov55-Attheya_sp.AAC.2
MREASKAGIAFWLRNANPPTPDPAENMSSYVIQQRARIRSKTVGASVLLRELWLIETPTP